MSPLKGAIVRSVLAILPEIIELVRNGASEPEIEARARRLAIDRAYEETRKLRDG